MKINVYFLNHKIERLEKQGPCERGIFIPQFIINYQIITVCQAFFDFIIYKKFNQNIFLMLYSPNKNCRKKK